MKLVRYIIETLGIALFSMALPFLFVAVLVWGQAIGISSDETWLIKITGTILMPFGIVLWYITSSHLLLRRRGGYLMQLVVFLGTALLMYMLLSCGVSSSPP